VHAGGVCCLVAAVELLIGHRFWLSRSDFVGLFIDLDTRADGKVTAFVDWEAAAAALRAGRLVCSDSQGQVLMIAVSVAEDVPVGLRDALGGLDAASLALVAEAVLRTGGGAGSPAIVACAKNPGRVSR
jgi:hypothetical protein